MLFEMIGAMELLAVQGDPILMSDCQDTALSTAVYDCVLEDVDREV